MELLAAALLLGAGVYASFRTGFVQVRRFGRALAAGLSGGPEAAHGGVSPFQAAATSLAATIGTGNIAGVAGAILLGGPGAVFWMWVSAFFGMALKYVEILLCLKLRGRAAGSPMRAIERGLPARWRFLAYAFALCGALAALGMGNLVQINTLAESVCTLACAFRPGLSADALRWIALGTGLVVAFAIAAVLFGGAVRVGRAAALIVPAMSALYLVCAGVVIAKNLSAVPQALWDIVRGAFAPEAVLGGAAGITFRTVFVTGMSRGVFTHEAGLGTGALVHGAADTTDAVRQSLYGVFEVFFDTMLMCTVTALCVLVSRAPVPYGGAQENGALAIRAFAGAFGDGGASVILSVSLLLFSFSSMLAFALSGTRCAKYLFGPRAVAPYRLLFLGCVAAGSVLDLAVAWRAAELVNACMAIPNVCAMLLLARRTDIRSM